MNALMTASMGGAFSATGHHPRFYHAIAWTGAAYSCIIGVSSSSASPAICPPLG